MSVIFRRHPLNPHDIQFMAASLPLAGGDVVDDEVLSLVEVGGASGGTGLVVLLELDGPAKGMALIERSGLAKSWGACDI